MRTLWLITISCLSIAADPCAEMCAFIPGACGAAGSHCGGSDFACSDLYWFEPGLIICNHLDVDDCNEYMPSLMCDEADYILKSKNADAVISYQFMVSGSQRGGRKVFGKLDMSSHYASVLQVVLHSRALRRAVFHELQSGLGEMFENRVLSSFVVLVNRMDIDNGALDLTAFKSAIEESVRADDDSIDTPLEVLGVFLDEIARVSISLASALTWDLLRSSDETGWSMERAAGLVGFPTSASGGQTRWSIKELLEAHFEEIGLERPTELLPELLSIAIDRYPDGSPDGRINAFVETPMEIDLGAGDVMYRYRLVGIVREINDVYVADYFDSNTDEWIHANDPHLHVIQGQPRNGGSDCLLLFYEKI